eukprot:TRINITY_DN42586_c0_g1_i1.p1 TRINITY_DN42586_c0_g1~~TRINITY_DN42586_c0_g1_i1.p1  ORF type:complete len:336 (-),score=57.93 TRINITY_DN42586_c0_g1_i1:37-1044(-)
MLCRSLLRVRPRAPLVYGQLVRRSGTIPKASAAPDGFLSRIRAVIPANYFVHTGNVMLLLAVNMSDMLALRSLSVVASCCGIAYNLLQPKPLIPPATWGVFFVSCHLYRIHVLLMERRDIELDEVETVIWNSTFQHVFTKVQMRELLDIGERVHAKEGQVIAKAGEQSLYSMFLLADGEIKVESRQGTELGRSQAGEFINEFRYVRGKSGEPEPVTSSYSMSSIAIRWDTRKLDEYLQTRPEIACKLKGLFGMKMILKLERRNAEEDAKAYTTLIGGIVVDGEVTPAEMEHLKKVREVHELSLDVHRAALKSLGLSEEDFQKMVAKGASKAECEC